MHWAVECGAQTAELRAPLARHGFTLLEMILATFVSVLLMGALYVAVDMQLRHEQLGRDAIERDTLARALFSRMTNEIKACVTPAGPVPPPPKAASTPTTASSSTPSTTTPNTGSSAGTPTTTSNSASSTPTSTASSSTSTALRDTIQFTLGVQGTENTLTLYVSRLPRELDDPRAPTVSDLRLISYWLATDGTKPVGLARREFKRVTSEEANGSAPASMPDETPHIIADEVVSLQFRYFDGVSWYDTWDGTATGFDGLTPLGPPLLIEIVMGMVVPGGDSGGRPDLKVYRHVVSIATADGVVQ
jgi:prepilin-type N-terminal cleavage/methylation domain-containing protein